MSILRRTINPQVRVIDERKGIAEYVASDETLDSYREVIVASGWKFNHFKKNSPFVDSHNYRTIESCLGKVIDFTVRGKRLVEVVQWAVDVSESRLAQLGWKLTAAGFLRAVSVGFEPVRTIHSGSPGWSEKLIELGLDENSDVRQIYIEQEQLELSAVILGANPNAVSMARAYKTGILSDADLHFISNADVRSITSRRNASQSTFLQRFEKAVKRL